MNWKIIAGSVASLAIFAVAGTEVAQHATASTSSTKTEAPTTGAPVSATDAHLLPGGATSINETYQDWRVICQQADKRAGCIMVQQVIDQKTRKTVMNMELSTDRQGLRGIVLLPFGLDLGKGIALKVDNTVLGQPIAFRTCLPAGCIAPLSFDVSALSHLQASKTMQIAAVSVRGQNIAFPVSLNGFFNAFGRIKAISK
ncbi:invasion associated locus B family protein [Komagataeibacter sp. FNDCF1]|uniref:invasion associated locus B family protein n=1 Tax=Komagataeibacter sp. FNDCF1 TaxID=2878681 RepID=UPI002104450F|nr:invasion associated locus B family protein [Komagataeibacter sp. FNDCF1]MCE2563116.1 invasion associated locus B family protein [Komagataeibacter sp. FNDCF1]